MKKSTSLMALAGALALFGGQASFAETKTSTHADKSMSAEGNCGASKCHADKSSEGKCGEGKCGASKNDKCGEGSCGANHDMKKSSQPAKKTMKAGEGKCGEGKCGS